MAEKDNKYYDTVSANMLLSSLVTNIGLFGEYEMEQIGIKDFVDPKDKVIFSILNNMYVLGHEKVTTGIFESCLETQPKSHSFYLNNGGREKLEKLIEVGKVSTFHPSLDRVKKFSLLRNLSKFGLDVSKYYDPEVKNPDKQTKQETWLNHNSLSQITDEISQDFDNVIIDTKVKAMVKETHISDGLESLIESFKKNPEFGAPVAISMGNTITRGARKGKFYIRSAPTGGGTLGILY